MTRTGKLNRHFIELVAAVAGTEFAAHLLLPHVLTDRATLAGAAIHTLLIAVAVTPAALRARAAIDADLRAREKAERRIAESEARFRAILDGSSLLAWEFCVEEDRFTFVSIDHERHGFAREQWLKPGFWDSMLHPDDRAGVTDECLAEIRAGRAHRLNYRVITSDGAELHISDYVSAPSIVDGKTIVRGVAFDVTHQREAERLLTESELRTRLIIDTALDAVVTMDADGLVTQWNAQAERTFGWSAAEAIGRPLDELILPANVRASYRASLDECRRCGPAARPGTRVEIQALHRDGREITVELAITTVRSGPPGTSAAWFSAFLRDITENKRFTLALADSETRFRTLADSAPILVWMSDLGGCRNYFNRPWLTFRGRTLQQECGEGWREGVHPDDLDRVVSTISVAVEARRPFEVEYRLRRFDGVYRTILGRGVPRTGASGEFAGFVGACSDVTDLRDAQRSAEASCRAKSEFLANMSHEIRTPLTAILGFAEVLRDELEPDRAAVERLKMVDTILTAGQHLLTLINDILDLSKVESGRVDMEHIETHLPSLLQEIQHVFAPRALGKGVRFTIGFDGAVPERIVGDPTRLRQILINLAGNAAKFTEAGEIRVVARVDGAPTSQRLIIEVTDTGPGLTPAQAERLFQPFSQADSTVTRKHGGTGLGLTICRRLAHLMGGDVVLARTVPGEGSTFRLELPLRSAPGATLLQKFPCSETPCHPAPTSGGPGSNLCGRILLAEDGLDNQRLIAFVLRKAGATVDVADNGRIALEMIRDAEQRGGGYDLLLTDMQMPEMDGYTLARSLRSQGSTIPIVALTANAMAEDRQRCLNAGCDDFVSKPVDRAMLHAVCQARMRSPYAQRRAA